MSPPSSPEARQKLGRQPELRNYKGEKRSGGRKSKPNSVLVLAVNESGMAVICRKSAVISNDGDTPIATGGIPPSPWEQELLELLDEATVKIARYGQIIHMLCEYLNIRPETVLSLSEESSDRLERVLP